MTAIAEARVETDRAGRYLTQLCRHASQMGRHEGARAHMRQRDHADGPKERPEQVDAEWTPTSGTITLAPWGRCALDATSEALILHAEASTTEDLRRIQDLLGWNLARFGRRDELTVTWQSAEAVPERTGPAPGRRHVRTVVLTASGVLGVALMLAVHLGVGGGVLAASQWLGWTAAGLVIAPILLVVGHAAIPFTVLHLRRRRGHDR
ncbi:DUF2218 domain-containing protein [Pseudonocardia sp. CA-107938]|uniref:DUF2218 domain-containing protein n=1 Tax=Pseudonocardia sp. CA-107938 TaxID=3240021 RepID=UPI003D8D6C69